MAFTSVEGLLRAAGQVPLWQAIRDDDCRDRGVVTADSWSHMEKLWTAMQESVGQYDPALRSTSALVGGEGGKVEGSRAELCGPFLREVIATALKTGECNACMKRIVAAPTAGSCGVLPAVLLPLQRRGLADEAAVHRALYIAAGFGQVVAARATLAGAEGGCQAEVGAASGMAAAALVDIKGGTAEQCAEAFAMALTNLEGLVCDPVAGLVEIPCIKRNVIGAMNAVSAADMALAGVVGHIPADEVIDAMAEVGNAMSKDLRETGIGGLAGTPTGRAICEIVTMDNGEEED